MKNWWYYHKWYVICGLILLGVTVHLIGNALGLWTSKPDFQIAYVGETELPADTVSALERAFASIGKDFNGDGKVLVQINQYVRNSQNPESDAAYYRAASEIQLMADISDCESYFFLTDDPELLQKEYQILAAPDGSCPAGLDFSIEGKAVSWADCPLLAEMDLGSYSAGFSKEEADGSNQELLSGLFIGRRCFYTDSRTAHPEACSDLWDFITQQD